MIRAQSRRLMIPLERTMTQRSLVLAILLTFSSRSFSTAGEKPNEGPSGVSSIFVLGTSPAAEHIRSVLRDGNRGCFSLATKPADADAFMDVALNSQTEPARLVGSLVRKAGALIWSGSVQIPEGPFSVGLKTASGLLVQHLARDAQCKQSTNTKGGSR
jgi:hypothetical protein